MYSIHAICSVFGRVELIVLASIPLPKRFAFPAYNFLRRRDGVYTGKKPGLCLSLENLRRTARNGAGCV